MSEHGENPEPKFIVGREDSVTVTAEGETMIEASCMSVNMSEEEVREAAADQYGMDPDEVGIKQPGESEYQYRNGERRLSVGFVGRWNSSWDPRAEQPPGNPNLN